MHVLGVVENAVIKENSIKINLYEKLNFKSWCSKIYLYIGVW